MTRITAALAAGVVIAAAAVAHADGDCPGTDRRGRKTATCMDPGNRVFISVATDGIRAGVELRHRIVTEDRDVTWRLEHALLQVVRQPDTWSGTVYTGRFLRHSRDGHIVLPLGKPRNVFVPFNIGGEVDVGSIERRADVGELSVGAVRAAPLIELLRSADFRRRLAIGPVASWDIALVEDVSAIDEHLVTPFTAGSLDGYFETEDGLTQIGIRLDAGWRWSTVGGWQRRAGARATIERVLIAVNDQPLSLFTSGWYRSDRKPAATDPGPSRWGATVGVRFALARLVPPR